MKMNQVIMGFIKKEMTQTLRDTRMRIILFAAPMIQLTLFGLAISTEVSHLKLSFVYKPNDILMEKIEDRSYASGWFIPAPRQDADPFQLIQSGRADAVLMAPEGGLTRAMAKGTGQVQLLVDAENIVKAQSLVGYTQAVVGEAVQEQIGMTGPPPAVRFAVRYLYNPEMKTSIFMVPGVLCMVLVIVTVILTSSAIAKEKELGTFENLIASPAKPYELLLGKTLPYVIFGMMDMGLVLAVAVLGFHVPERGPLWALFLASLVFVVSTVGMGVLLASFVQNMQQASMLGFLFIFPAIMLSGLMFSVENMPWIFKPFAYLDPLYYFVTLLRNIMLKGGDPILVGTYSVVLAVMGIFMVWLSFKRFKQTLN
jgi:ABC-2 type transport system permease protein